MNDNTPTTFLRRGDRVLADPRTGYAKTYTNRTQAHARAHLLNANEDGWRCWVVIQRGRPWYVACVTD